MAPQRAAPARGASGGLAFLVRGLDCAVEVAALERELLPLVGRRERLGFDLLTAKLTVEVGEEGPDVAQIQAAVVRAGLRAEPWPEASAAGEAAPPERRPRLATALTWASGLAAGVGLAVELGAGGFSALAGGDGLEVLTGGATDAGHALPLPAALAYGVAIATGVGVVLPKAWRALLRLRPDMNLLMTIAVVGAIGLGQLAEAASVAFLFALAQALETWSVGRARRAIGALLRLAPTRVRLRDAAGGEREVAAEAVPVGARFVVRPGDRLPLDGRVVAGASEVDQAPITGESLPVEKAPGDEVFAGTINGDGTLEVEATRVAADTTLAHIIRLVGEAQRRRAPTELWVERFAARYTPAVLALALAVLVVPPLVAGGAWSLWFYRALVLLVIACPCALVISTPVTVVAALAAAARHGVLIKGGAFLEVPARLAAIAFDKTGTLTEGRLSVVELVPLAGHSEEELLAKLAAIEARSSHPAARAIVAYAAARGVPALPADDVRVLPGKGAIGRFDGGTLWVGSHRYLEERGQETPEVRARLVAMARAGRTVVVAGTADHVCGLVALADAPRPAAAAVLAELRREGIERCVLLTGDSAATAKALAQHLHLDEVRAELLPADKVAAIAELVERHGAVAMVGDGVNDAPALARSTLGVAMAAAGSDAAIETADVALMTDHLERLPWLIRHSRRALATVRANIAFALGVKAVFVLLTLAGYASLWAAIAADMGASLLVIGNGLRLLRVRASRTPPPPARPTAAPTLRERSRSAVAPAPVGCGMIGT